jgi:preprotein translocase subunit SecD
MAARRSRPGRALIAFFVGMGILFGLVALAGSWKPSLGLDLQGGLRITLTALGNPSEANLEEARRIIDQRVNARGVTEAEVTAQSGRFIVVEIPGSTENRREMEELVKAQAQLRFRLVACATSQQTNPCAGGGGSAPLGRAPLALEPAKPARPKQDKTDTTESPSDTASPSGTASPTDTSSPDATDTTAPEGEEDEGGSRTAEDELAWINSPEPQWVQLYNELQCDEDGNVVRTKQDGTTEPAPQQDDPDKPLVACEVRPEGTIKYLLSRSVIEGTEIQDADAGVPQNDVEWGVNIDIGNDRDEARPPGSTGGEDDFESISRALVTSGQLFAIVLDGQVISAPTMEAVITDGRSRITGDFSETEAKDLANSLRYGALPIAFEKEATTDDIGPSLAGDQLTAGLIAGAAGLSLVMLYCLLYYRGLGLVVFGSLLVAASITYAMVLLLSETAGFTLTLPGIAGFIIAVGITADSFVIYFERIRDEMREGKSMRVAVETGWARARVTRFAANTVNLLAALVLYIFATGAVKGFGFALGLSTLIDLAVLFWFTKPMVSWLAHFKAFNSGHKLSGLSPETLGIDGPQPRTTMTAGGNA